MLLAGFIAGRVTGSGSGGTQTLTETVERSVVVPAEHIGSVRDARDRGPLDIARVASKRRGADLLTTVVARTPWRDSLLRRRGGVKLWLFYDTDDNGTTDHRDDVFLFRGSLTSWISDYGQGVQVADVKRRNARTITVVRDATVFYNGAGEGSMITSSPIGVAVLARWRGGSDRVPDRGWITVPPPRD
jgi:hypothetical protein